MERSKTEIFETANMLRTVMDAGSFASDLGKAAVERLQVSLNPLKYKMEWNYFRTFANRSGVVMVPGIGATPRLDFKLLEEGLNTVHHFPVYPEMGFNFLTPNEAEKKIMEAVKKAQDKSGDKAVLAGHSYGGVQSIIFAGRHPEELKGLITIATPTAVIEGKIGLNAFITIPLMGIIRRTENAEQLINEYLHSDVKVPWLSVSVPGDKIVDQRACLARGKIRKTIEVEGSHAGMGSNPEAVNQILHYLTRWPAL